MLESCKSTNDYIKDNGMTEKILSGYCHGMNINHLHTYYQSYCFHRIQNQALVNNFYTICEFSSINTLNTALKPFLCRLKSILFRNKDYFLRQNSGISFIVGKIYIACKYLRFSTRDLFLINQKKKKVELP